MDLKSGLGRTAACAGLAAALFAAGGGAAAAPPEQSGVPAAVEGVVSAGDIAASATNLAALANAAVEMPIHPLPDGSLTSVPDARKLESLPLAPEPNAAVFGGVAPSFAHVKGFVGLFGRENVKLNGVELEPPDQGLAVNNNVAAELVKSIVQFFNATTGKSLSGPIADSKFFLIPSGFTVNDPQALFDPTTGRWFLDVLMSDAKTKTMDFALAISQTGNPLGKYWIYHIEAFSSTVSGCGGRDCFPDYAKIGYDADAFYITANLFSNVSGKFVESAIFVLPKKVTEAGAKFTYFRFDDPSDFVVQPSVPAPGEPFSTAENGSEFLMSAPASGKLALLAIDNTKNIVKNGKGMRLLRTTIRAEAYGSGTVPSVQPDVIGPYCKSKGVTSAPSLDGGYGAFQATIQKAGGSLYGVLPFGAKDGKGLNRDVLAWFELRPTLSKTLSAAIVHQGYIVPANGYSISYPALAMGKTGRGVIGMTMTNKSSTLPGGFPSAAITEFKGSKPSGGIVVTGRGDTSDDGFTGCPAKGPGRVGRWGDYGAATVDAKTGFFYTANEMIPNPKTFPRGHSVNWGTYITQLH